MINLTSSYPTELHEQHGGTVSGPVRHDNPNGTTVADILRDHPHVISDSAAKVLERDGRLVTWAPDRYVPTGVVTA